MYILGKIFNLKKRETALKAPKTQEMISYQMKCEEKGFEF